MGSTLSPAIPGPWCVLGASRHQDMGNRLPALLQVRDAAVAALDAWVGSVLGEKVLPAVADFLAGPKASSEGRVTGLRWIASAVAARKAEKCIDVVLRAAVTASGDKAVEVRDAAASLAGSVSEVLAPLSTMD